MRKIQNIIITSFIAFVGLLMFAECKVNEADIKGGLPFIDFALTDTVVTKAEQVVDIPISTNRPLKVEVETEYGSWITGEVSEGILRLVVKANDLETTRVATLTLKSTNSIVTTTLTVTQDASGELTIKGDLILRSIDDILNNTYTKTTKNLIVGDVQEIVVLNAPQSAATAAAVKTTRYGDSLIKVAHSAISDAMLDTLAKDIHLIQSKGVLVLNTEVTKLPVDLVKSNSVSKLFFDNNKIKSLPSSEVMKGMALTELSLRGNEISDISSLAECSSLTYLDVSETEVYDLDPLLSLENLQDLKLEGAPITPAQWEVFSEKMPGVKGDTTGILASKSPLPEVKITNVEKLSDKSFELTAKVDTKGAGNPVKVGFYVGKTRTLAEMEYKEAEYSTQDSVMTLSYTGDILTDNIYFFRGYAQGAKGEGYSELEHFGSITLREDVILKKMSEIETFAQSNVSHIEGSLYIGDLTDKESLKFKDSDIDDISALKTLVGVTGGIYIGKTKISDVSVLANLESVETMWLKGNKLESLPDFSKISNLKSVNVSGNIISDVAPLLTDADLKELHLGDEKGAKEETNKIGILNGLEKLTALKYLDLSGLPLHKWQVDSLKAKMTSCEIKFVSGGKTPVLPTVSNKSIKYTDSGVQLCGVVENAGAYDIVEYGFYYGKDIKALTKVKAGESISGGSDFSTEVTIPDDEKYYYQAYAVNTKGESHSESYGEFSLGSINLSEHGYANTYIVSNAGRYTFHSHVIGNGQNGIISGAGFHTENAEITPASAKLLWEEKEGMITDVQYRSETQDIIFTSNGAEGNAVIAACDAGGVIIWSWQIWCTDKPVEQKYVNSVGTFYVLDRNIGATRADRGSGDQWKESVGTLYQWGRKDPFIMDGSFDKTTSVQSSILYYINNPSVFAYASEWDSNFTDEFWQSETKTIYDPCPVGYKVQTNSVAKGLDVSGAFDKGWNVLYDGTNTTWYPVTPNYDCFGEYRYTDSYGYVWLSDNAFIISISSTEFVSTTNPSRAKGDGYPVRCMKDDGFVDMSLPNVSLLEIKNVTTNSATVVAQVNSQGGSDVTERGIVVGGSSDVSLENGTKYPSGTGVGEFSVDLTDLTSLTRYYVRAYATNADGTSYSQVMSFTTEYEGEAVNLSAAGTANSYIVRDNSREFVFDAGVKGNSTELVGNAASAEVIWETKNTSEAVTKGEIIKSVSLMENGFVSFSIPTEYTPGNALIAVKDANGVILWSWHIWVVDFDAESTRQTYQSGAVMMDRNLGALNVIENDPRANGLFYIWGRKDPMAGTISGNSYAQTYPENIFTRDATNSISDAVQNPIHFGTSSWSNNNTLWQSQKTKFDPCPVGWRVPDGGPDGVWSDFGTYSKDVTNGAYFNAPYSTPGAFYPRGGYATVYDTNIYFYGAVSCYWSCSSANDSEAYTFALWNGQGEPNPIKGKQSLFNVRCQKDDNSNSVSVPAVKINEVKDIQVTTAVVESEILRDGRGKITERGVIWGEVPNLSIDNAPNKVVSEDAGSVFEAELTGLTDATKYYVRAYAKNNAGVGYSDEVSFTTKYSGEVKDLSANGTANSYIVNKYGIYSFDATVKGNSTNKVEGTPTSAVVLWETRNTTEAITVGSVITDVTFENGRVKFTTSESVNPGNALIAVKDADGIILWSWHIWVVDYNPEIMNDVYPSGAVVMDRDLGALSNGSDIQANGLLYQWGRKDPFMGVGGNNLPAATAPAKAVKYEKTSAAKGTLAYVEIIPQVMLYSDANWKDWMYTPNNTLWSEEKTLYDPCPSGWKVPSYEDYIWDDLSGVTYLTSSYAVDGTNADFGTDHWTSTARTDDNGRVFTKRGNTRGKVSPARVRCVRESELEIEDVTSAAKSSTASVTAKVTSGTLSSIKEYGVVMCDDNNQNVVITNENILVVKGDSSHIGLGELNVNIESLSSNTRYYYRVYVIGDNGIEYSQVNTLETKSSGHNENVGDEDYEW